MARFGDGRGPPDIEGMTSLKVDNLTYRTTMDDLETYFKKYGDIGDIYLPKDRNTHNSRGFAFVRFYEKKDANDAMDGMDGKVIDGREIRVNLARYGRPENQYNPRGGRSGYRSRDSGRDRRRSPRRRSRSRSRSGSPPRRRSRSPRSRSPVQRSRSPARRSRSPGARNVSRSRSRSPR